MRLAFTKASAVDLDLIADFIPADSPASAQSVYWTLVGCAERLKDFPNIGRIGRLPRTRELTVQSLPYVIVYQVYAETVTIIAILHAARDLRSALDNRRKNRES